MSERPGPAKSIDPGQVIRTTLRICGDQAGPMLLACAVAILPFTAIDVAFAAAGAEAPAFLNIVAAFANAWLYATLGHLALPAIEGRPISFAEASRAATPLIGAMFGLSLLQGLGVIVGLLLFVVPGVYFWVWGYVAVPVALFEGLRGTAALRRSGELTRDARVPIFVLGVLTTLMLGVAITAIVVPIILAALDETTFGAEEAPALGGGLDYAVLVLLTAVQFAWSMLGMAAMTVVYSEVREREAGAEGRAVADVFS